MNIVEQSYWDDSYKEQKIERQSSEDPIVKLIHKYIPKANNEAAVYEVGCFPGRYLTAFGDLGYILNGIDTTRRVNDLSTAFISMGYNVGKFHNKDYTTVEHKPEFEVVASFGFIEHFRNWETIIHLKTMQVMPEGYLIITTPNFRGLIQYLYHRLVDHQNLNRHIISSMSPAKWAKILIKQDFEIISKGFVGREFWDENYNKNAFERFISKVLIKAAKFSDKVKLPKNLTHSYAYIIAKKR